VKDQKDKKKPKTVKTKTTTQKKLDNQSSLQREAKKRETELLTQLEKSRKSEAELLAKLEDAKKKLDSQSASQREAKKREAELLPQLEKSRKKEAELLAKLEDAKKKQTKPSPSRKKTVKVQNGNKDQPPPARQDNTQKYKIGDLGPAGGIVFYDKGNNTDGWRYLEVAPKDLGKAKWGLNAYDLKGTSTEIGFGNWNTELIIAALNMAALNRRGESGTAAQLCKDYTLNGYNDWFLPSRDELNLLYVNLKVNVNLGKNQSFFDNLKKNNFEWFSDSRYWSSSQDDLNDHFALEYAFFQWFGDGYHGNFNNKFAEELVRAVRAF